MKPGGMSDLTIPEYDPPPTVTRLSHDPLCPVCENGHGDGCGCTCFCDFIADVREDERRILRPFLSAPQGQMTGITPFPRTQKHPPQEIVRDRR
jgi:hypothetical protein